MLVVEPNNHPMKLSREWKPEHSCSDKKILIYQYAMKLLAITTPCVFMIFMSNLSGLNRSPEHI